MEHIQLERVERNVQSVPLGEPVNVERNLDVWKENFQVTTNLRIAIQPFRGVTKMKKTRPGGKLVQLDIFVPTMGWRRPSLVRVDIFRTSLAKLFVTTARPVLNVQDLPAQSADQVRPTFIKILLILLYNTT